MWQSLCLLADVSETPRCRIGGWGSSFKVIWKDSSKQTMMLKKNRNISIGTDNIDVFFFKVFLIQPSLRSSIGMFKGEVSALSYLFHNCYHSCLPSLFGTELEKYMITLVRDLARQHFVFIMYLFYRYCKIIYWGFTIRPVCLYANSYKTN